MRAFTKLGLMALAGAMIGTASAAPTFTFATSFRLFNSSGADVTGVWVSRGFAGAGASVDNTDLHIRLYRADGGSLAGCSVTKTKITIDQSTTTASVPSMGTVAPMDTYFKIPITLTSSTLEGSFFIKDDSEATPTGSSVHVINGCLDGGASAPGTAVNNFIMVAKDVTFAFDDSGVKSGVFTLDGVIANPVPFATVTAPTLTVSAGAGNDLHTAANVLAATTHAKASAFFDFPEAWNGIVTVTYSSVTSGTSTATFSLNGFSSLPYGIYEIGLRAGLIVAKTGTPNIMNAPRRIRIIWGPAPTIYNTVTSRRSPQRDTSNTTHAIFAVNNTRIGIYQIFGDATHASVASNTGTLSTAYDKLYPYSSGFSGFDVTSLMNGLATNTPVGRDATNTPFFADYTFNTFLSDGWYTLKRKSTPLFIASEAQKRDIVIIIDRTPPMSSNATHSGGAQAIGLPGTVKIPTTMFTDAVSSQARWIRIVSHRFVNSDGNGFWCTNGVSLSAAYCLATVIRGPPTNVLVEIVAEDEAGNQAVGFLTIPIVAPPTVALTVADKRGVYGSSVVTGSTATQDGSGNAFVTVVATFSEPVVYDVNDLPVLTITTASGTFVAGNSPVFSSGNRVVTYTVTEGTTIASGTAITIQMAAGEGVRASDNVVNVMASNTVSVTIDKVAPTYAIANQGSQAYVAAVGSPFLEYLPITLFGDAVSAAEKRKIVAASTNQNVGLTVTLGPLGRAYISGTATSQPTASSDSACFTPSSSQSWVKFTLTAEDEAGNQQTGYYCVAVVASAGVSATLTFNRNTLNFAEHATNTAALDASASFTADSTINKIFTYLETSDTIPAATPSEKVTITTTSPVSETGFAKVTGATLTGVNSLTGSTFTAAQVTSALQSIFYGNSMAKLTPGFRTVRIIVTKTSGSYQVVVAVTAKTIYVTNVNDVPTIKAATLPASQTQSLGSIAIAEGSTLWSAGLSILPTTKYLALVDADDDTFTAATLTLDTSASNNNYGACDPARDMLYLPSAYTAVPTVGGTWNPATCTLTLRSFTGATATNGEMSAALHGVRYINSDRYNPSNGKTDFNRHRQVSIKVTDAASNGRASAPVTTATAVTADLTVTLTNEEPFFVWEKLYGPGGMLYNTNQTAGIKVLQPTAAGSALKILQQGARDFVAIRKFAFDFDSTVSASTTMDIPLDFSKVSDGVFANGALLDFDTASLTAGMSVSFVVKAEDCSSAAPSNPLDVTTPSVLSSTNTGKLTVKGATTLTPGTYCIVGSVPSGPDFYIWVDARAKICYLDNTFLSAVTSAATLATNTAKYVHDPNLCVYKDGSGNTLLTKYAATVSASPASTAASYFVKGTTVLVPGSSALSTYVYESIDGDSSYKRYFVRPAGAASATDATGAAVSSYFNFHNLNNTLGSLRHDMIRAGVTGDEAAARLALLRPQARGMASFYFEKDSFATTSGTFDFKFGPMGQYQVNTLPAGNPGEILDANLVFELTPACMKFVFPVRACLLVGDTPSGYTRSIKVSSQRDCTDNSKGWTAWESLSGVFFDASTGLICGNTTHFSALATFLTPLGSNPTTSKAISMGGSCPNECSGHGYCRSNGKCQCFSGFNGNDCSARTCPVAESWDGGNFAVHQLKECAERGVCNTKTGQCACYPGFEGSACQRTACPNACSGHGQCKLLKDLPKVQATGYSKWEVDRLQKCVCDAGYTGLDCSERICPFGDDPETTCNDKRQVQQVKLDFGSLPGDANAYGLFDTDELALTFRSYFGQNLSVPRIVNVFASDGSGATNFARSLKSLPGFAVSDVSVSASIASDFTSAIYNVTFDGTSLAVALAGSASARLTATGNTVSGNQALLICPTNSYGSLGCQAAGCRPKYKQARLLSQPTSGVRVSSTAILRQPDAITAGSNVGKWGVSVTVIIANRAETGEQTYNITSKIYERDDGMGVAETPLPPAGSKLRSGVTLPYGLEVDFDAGTLTPGTYEFKWRLPTCSVTQVQSASAELELAECSRRGNCDRATGTCKCFPGYSGGSCGAQTVVV